IEVPVAVASRYVRVPPVGGPQRDLLMAPHPPVGGIREVLIDHLPGRSLDDPPGVFVLLEAWVVGGVIRAPTKDEGERGAELRPDLVGPGLHRTRLAGGCHRPGKFRRAYRAKPTASREPSFAKRFRE